MAAALPDCQQCRHFFITHQMPFRYGCRAFGMQCQRFPVIEVFEASGQSCAYFQAKPARPVKGQTGA